MNRRLPLVSSSLLTLIACGSLLLAVPPDQKSQTKTSTAKKVTPPKAPEAPAVSTATISVNGVNDIDPTKAFGSKTAPVVVEIYSDFQCPACKQLFLNTTQKVMENYVNTGKVYPGLPPAIPVRRRILESANRSSRHCSRTRKSGKRTVT